MKLSHASSYALRALVYLAGRDRGRLVPSSLIAHEGGIPELFLLKVLKPLVSARVLMSLRGPTGGYRLARAPETISMLDVIEAVDGPVRGEAPFASDNAAMLDRRLQTVCETVADRTRLGLRRVRISDLGHRKAGKPADHRAKARR